jgi:hypothetical protein
MVYVCIEETCNFALLQNLLEMPMKTKRILVLMISLTLLGCGESVEKLKKTEEIVKKIDAEKDGDFFLQASIEEEESHLSVTLKHELFQAYYTGALYDIILELHRQKIHYDDYEIKSQDGKVVWSVTDPEIDQLTKTIDESKKLIQVLEKKDYVTFLDHTNFNALGISDSAFLAQITLNPIYPNTEYKGFSMLEREFNGVKKKLMYVFFLNAEQKQNLIVLSPEDQLVYGLEY